MNVQDGRSYPDAVMIDLPQLCYKFSSFSTGIRSTPYSVWILRKKIMQLASHMSSGALSSETLIDNSYYRKKQRALYDVTEDSIYEISSSLYILHGNFTRASLIGSILSLMIRNWQRLQTWRR